MKADTPSETALRIAGTHVTAARDPVFRQFLAAPDDPHPEWFARAHSARARRFLVLWKWGPTRRLLDRLSNAVLPGGILHILLRKRAVEEIVRTALKEGFEQVVIFGAGLDALAVRLHPDFPQVRFIEIDHPATQAVKRRALEAHHALPAQVTLLPVDFTRESVEEKLRAEPTFRADARSLFVAEGLLMYLGQEEVDALFACVRRNSAPGSRFLFSMVDAAVAADPNSSTARSIRILERMGEPVRSTIERKRLDGFLRKHGFRSRSVTDHRALRATYLAPAGLDLPLMEGELILLAETIRQ